MGNMQKNHNHMQDLIRFRSLGLVNCMRLPYLWQDLALDYRRIRKRAEKETPPGRNVLWAGVLQTVYSKDRTFTDRAVELVGGNIPEDEILRISGASLCYVDDSYGEGLQRIRKAYRMNPCIANARELARNLCKPQYYCERLRLCEQILSEEPRDLVGLEVGSVVLLTYQQWKKAEAHISRAIAIMPKGAVARELSGDLYHQQYEYQRALGEYLKARRYRCFTSAVLWSKIASCHLFLGAFRKAQRAAKRALKLNPGDTYAKSVWDEVCGRRRMGVEYCSGKFNPKNFPWLRIESARERVPGEATLCLAAMETVQKQDIRHLQDGIALTKDNVSADVLRRISGWAKFGIGQVTDGIAEMRKAHHLNPSTENLRHLARGLRESRDTRAEARKHFEQILSDSPNDYEALYSLGMLSEDPQEAFDFYAKAFQTRPRDWRMVYNMAEALYRMNHFDQSVQRFEEARRLCFENPADISIGIARCRLATGQYEDALKEAERAFVEDPTSDEARKLLQETKESM